MTTRKLISAAIALLLATSCNRLDVAGMFFSSGTHTEDRVAEWLAWNGSHPAVVISNAPDQYNIYVCSDIHLEGDVSRVEQFLRHEYADPLGLFSIVNGDMARGLSDSSTACSDCPKPPTPASSPSATTTSTSTVSSTSSSISTPPPTPSPCRP